LPFAFQALHWVVSTFSFKLVNAVVHLINGLLLYGCASLCAFFIGVQGNKRVLFAALCAFLWLFLPLNTTTLFYVVQRMTLLAGSFTLLGMLGFLYGIMIHQKTGNKYGFLIASISMGAGYLFGVLSKENGVMLGVFVGVIYLLVVRNNVEKNRRLWDIWAVIFALTPVLMLFTYIVWDFRFLRGYGHRDFTFAERILTESRALWDYLLKIVFPSSERINIYNDSYVISKGLIEPVMTIVSIFSWVAFIIFAWVYRSRFPFVWFGLAWFLGGHLLESTVLPLELYFEHRNYVPSVGIIIALVWFLFFVWKKMEEPAGENLISASKVVKPVFLSLSLIFFIYQMSIFYIETQTWKNKETLNMAALLDRPDSFRVNQAAGGYLAGIGEIKQATYMFYALDKRWPGHPSTYAYLLYLQCVSDNVIIPSREKLEKRFLTGLHDDLLGSQMFEKIHAIKQKGACPKLSWNDFRYWVSLLMQNPSMPKYGPKQNLLKLLMISYVTEGNYSAAVSVLDEIELSDLRVSTIRLKMEILMKQNRDNEALALIQKVKERFSKNIRIWQSQSHYFIEAEKELLLKKSKVKRLFDINS